MEEKETIENQNTAETQNNTENQNSTEPQNNTEPQDTKEPQNNTEAQNNTGIQNTPQAQNSTESKEYWGMSEGNFMTFMHLSQFAGFIVPVAGYAAPIAMWITNKDQNEKIDQQGKYIVNFIISMVIYLTVSSILAIILIGFLFLFILGVIGIVFPIIGALKANKGEIWKYPLTIQFIK